MKKHFRLIVLGALGMLAGGLITFVVVLAPWESDDEASGQVQYASTDEEWIQLIRDAKRISEGEGKAPTPQVPSGTIMVDDCSQLPDTAYIHQIAHEPDPGGDSGQTVFDIQDTAEFQPYLLVVRWDAPPVTCPDEDMAKEINAFVRAGPAGRDRIDRHICEQMQLMARGEPKTDPTVHDASPAVAQEYLDAFCDEIEPEPLSPPAEPGR